MGLVFFTFFQVTTVQKLLKSVKIWQSCGQMYTATFYEPRQKYRFWYFQVRCTHKSHDVINCIIVACKISSRLKQYKNYKNRLRLAKVIVKNKMSRFLWFTVYMLLTVQGGPKKVSHILTTITLSNLNGFLQFFYRSKEN